MQARFKYCMGICFSLHHLNFVTSNFFVFTCKHSDANNTYHAHNNTCTCVYTCQYNILIEVCLMHNVNVTHSDSSNKPHHLCFVVYHIIGNFTLLSHGNAKKKQPFLPTLTSTLKRRKGKCVRNARCICCRSVAKK